MPSAEEKAPPHRSIEDMFTEILSILRSETRVMEQLDRLNAALGAQWTLDPNVEVEHWRPFNRLAYLRWWANQEKPACPKCGSALVEKNEEKAVCLSCGTEFEPELLLRKRPKTRPNG